MFNWLISVHVEILVVAVVIRATEVEIRQLEIGTSGTLLCDHVGEDPQVRSVQWYKSRNIDAFENGDPSLASWANGITDSQPNFHMEDTTFSLVIEKTTLEDEGLYKCSVESGDLFTESYYFTRTVMYVLPQKNPVITLDNDLIRVKCTVEHVQPMIYPVCEWSPDSNDTNAVPNEDGTYTTSVSCTLPKNKCTSRLYCSFSYSHYQRVGSLDLIDITTDSPMEIKTTAMSPIGTSVISAGDGFRTIDNTAIIVQGIFNILLIVTNVITLIMLIIVRRKLRIAKERKEKMIQAVVGTVALETEINCLVHP